MGYEEGRPQWAETQVLVRCRGPHEPLGSGRLRHWPSADACGAWSFVAMRRCCARPLVVWAAPDEDAPDQGDLLAAETSLGWTPDSYSRKVLQ